jgi:hypothetical protein
MANFSALTKLAVAPDKTAEYTFPFSLTEDPAQRVVLVCVPAGTQNKRLTNAVLKRRSGQSAQAMSAETIEESMESVVELYPEHVIRGWRNVFDDAGVAMNYSAAEGKSLLRMIRDNVPDKLQEFFLWAQNLDNWRVANAEVAAKN